MFEMILMVQADSSSSESEKTLQPILGKVRKVEEMVGHKGHCVSFHCPSRFCFFQGHKGTALQRDL